MTENKTFQPENQDLPKSRKTSMIPDEPDNEKSDKNSGQNVGISFDIPTDYAYETYRELQVRYMILKRMYVMSSSYYHRLNIFLFVMPILISQLLIAIMPVILHTNSGASSTITSIIASVTGVYLGLQQKLRWMERSQKWASIANLYDELTTRATYLKKGCKLTAMTHVKHKHYVGIGKTEEKMVYACEPYCRKHCPRPTKQQLEEDNRKQLLNFLNDAENLEKTMTAAVPIPPYWIKRRCYAKIDQLLAQIKQNKKEYNNERFETDEFCHINKLINDANKNDPIWMRCWTG